MGRLTNEICLIKLLKNSKSNYPILKITELLLPELLDHADQPLNMFRHFQFLKKMLLKRAKIGHLFFFVKL